MEYPPRYIIDHEITLVVTRPKTKKIKLSRKIKKLFIKEYNRNLYLECIRRLKEKQSYETCYHSIVIDRISRPIKFKKNEHNRIKNRKTSSDKN